MEALTHIWLEAPLFAETLALLPPQVHVSLAGDLAASTDPDVHAAQAVVASSLLRYTGELMDCLPRLRLIARTGIGVDNVDLAAATQRGIVVTNTPDGPTESTAEHTVAMLLALAKRLKQGDANMAAGRFGPRAGALVGTEVQGKTLGLLGLGRIGRRVAQICRLGLGMRVISCDPLVPAEQARALGVEPVDLDTVVAQADFLSLHLPLTADSRGIMDAARLARMKPGAYLLNLARGGLVDADALLAALESGHLAGAGLDVFEPEPPAADAPLRRHPNVIVTPHSASLTREGRLRMERMAVERLLAFFRGKRPADIVNPAAYVGRP